VGVWRPVPGLIWSVGGFAGVVLTLLQVAGVGVTLVAAAELGIGPLSGLTRPSPQTGPPPLRSTGLYGFVRHPIYFAWVLMVWPAALMTSSRLLFATITTLYLALAVPFEERTLRQIFGSAYDDYKQRVRWRFLPGVY
jgi:methanethiol S-methyltransferase